MLWPEVSRSISGVGAPPRSRRDFAAGSGIGDPDLKGNARLGRKRRWRRKRAISNVPDYACDGVSKQCFVLQAAEVAQNYLLKSNYCGKKFRRRDPFSRLAPRDAHNFRGATSTCRRQAPSGLLHFVTAAWR